MSLSITPTTRDGNFTARKTIAYFLGTYEDWGGASRALLNFVRSVDRNRFRPLVVLTKEGNLSRQLTAEGIDWLVFDIHDRSKNVLAYVWHILRAMRVFRREGVDLAHMNYGAIGWKPAEILAARLGGIPLINHFHATVPEASSYLRYCSAVVAVSDYVANHSQTLGTPAYAIHNVSYLQRFAHGKDIRSELGYELGDVLVMYMGQMIRAKGIEMLVDAFTRVPNENVKLIMAGAIRQTSGAYTEDEVRELVARDARIQYLGYRNDAENLYRTADIMVMPSQWEEPCAMILFEAAAAGKPLIATATGGTPEILRHGETGFLVDRLDVDGMAEYMRQLAENLPLRRQLGAQALYVATHEYANAPVKAMEQLYERLLPPRKA